VLVVVVVDEIEEVEGSCPCPWACDRDRGVESYG
jgi:hypothetical protein